MAGEHTRGEGCGLIGFNAEHLTRVDSRMKVLPMGVPDKLRGVAWPSSARTLRRAVKSVNERDPRCHLLSYFQIISKKYEHYGRTAGDKPEEGVGDGRSVWPGYPWLHAACNGWDNALRRRKAKPIA